MIPGGIGGTSTRWVFSCCSLQSTALVNLALHLARFFRFLVRHSLAVTRAKSNVMYHILNGDFQNLHPM